MAAKRTKQAKQTATPGDVIDLGGDPSRIGYARVSTADQTLDPQLDVLRSANVGRVFVDVVSGAKADRPGLAALQTHVRPGDTVVVVKLDRLGRSLVDLLTTLQRWTDSGVAFAAVEQGIDTSTAAGRMVCQMLGAVAEFERTLIVERTNAGLAAARARGRNGGRPTVMDAAKLARARRLLDAGDTLAQAAQSIGVSRATLARHLAGDTAKAR